MVAFSSIQVSLRAAYCADLTPGALSQFTLLTVSTTVDAGRFWTADRLPPWTSRRCSPGVAVAFEIVGALAMVVGFVIAVVLALRALRRHEGGQVAFGVLRTTLGSAILLGLEVLVAADLIRTITSKPSITDASSSASSC